MRNGDLRPSRLECQSEAATLLYTLRRNANIENSLALMTMSGTTPAVLVSLTNDTGKLGAALNQVRPTNYNSSHVMTATTTVNGSSNLLSAIKVAMLVLKNRQNPVQHQRIIAFVGSPLRTWQQKSQEPVSDDQINQLVKQMTRQRVALDLILFGAEQEQNKALAQSLINALSQTADPDQDPSHLLTIPCDNGSIIDILRQSHEVLGDANAPMINGDEYFDPDMDPELAMALKLSLEEEQARQERERKKPSNEGGQRDEAKQGESKNISTTSNEMVVEDANEELLMAKAIAMSMEQQQNQQGEEKNQKNNQHQGK